MPPRTRWSGADPPVTLRVLIATDRVFWQSLAMWFGAFGACGPPAGRGHSTHDQPGATSATNAAALIVVATPLVNASRAASMTRSRTSGDRLDRICWASLERPPRLAATMVSSPLGGTSASSSPANSTAPLAWTTTTSGVTDCSWTG
jgi:hypothetical protein